MHRITLPAEGGCLPTGTGTIYYKYVGVSGRGYGSSGMASSFTIVSADIPNGSAHRAYQRTKCLVYANKTGRRRPILQGIYPEMAGPLPATITAQLGHYECDTDPMQSGVTPEICKAQYTCTKETF